MDIRGVKNKNKVRVAWQVCLWGLIGVLAWDKMHAGERSIELAKVEIMGK